MNINTNINKSMHWKLVKMRTLMSVSMETVNSVLFFEPILRPYNLLIIIIAKL
jgi:hypothetical protein